MKSRTTASADRTEPASGDVPSVVPRRQGFAPVVAADARLLLLGSFPGEASLAAGQYYAHPRNQFWPLLGALTGRPIAAMPYDDRLLAAQSARIAIWDVNASCLRAGSLDSAIRQPLVNPFRELLARAPGIGAVGFNGAAAARHSPWFEALGLKTYRLPSSSPAHAALNFEQKLAKWSVLRDDGWLGGQTVVARAAESGGTADSSEPADTTCSSRSARNFFENPV